jgi:hypothetical protein
VNNRTKFEELVDVLADALFEMLLEGAPKNDTEEGGDEPQDAA